MRSTSPAVSDASGSVSDGELPCRFRSGSFGEQQKGACVVCGVRDTNRPWPYRAAASAYRSCLEGVVGIGAGRTAAFKAARARAWRLMMMTRNRRGRVLRCCGTAAMF